MLIKGIIDENFQDFKETSLYVAFPKCSFKCERECNKQICSNKELAHSPDIDVSEYNIVKRYLDNKLTSALVIGGLEPFDSYLDLECLIKCFRRYTKDLVVIYTGYYENEIEDKINKLEPYENIIIKFGRFIPDSKSKYDEVLGITLASDNQYGKRIC